jgi:ligand-binding SRPBCC domain-containing protein
MTRFIKKTRIEAPAQAVFAWHEQPDALPSLIPPWEKVRVKSQTGPISQEGSQVTLCINILGPISVDWVSEHHNYQAGRQFQDTQISGPFAHWTHTHRVIPIDETHCFLEDDIDYALPLAPLSHWVAGWMVHDKLTRMFDYRHAQVLKAFSREKN